MSSKHCSYCHDRGHNRRTCPELKAKIESLPSDDYRVERYKVRQQVKPRNCKYCGNTGHNIRGCEKLKEESSRYAELNHFFKMDIANYLNSVGIVKGNCFEYNFQIPLSRVYGDTSDYPGDLVCFEVKSFLQITDIRYDDYDLSYITSLSGTKLIIAKMLSYSITNLPDNFSFSANQQLNLNDYMMFSAFTTRSYQNPTLVKSFFVVLPETIINKYLNNDMARLYYHSMDSGYYKDSNIAKHMSFEDSFDIVNIIE